MVASGLRIACRLATWPTRRWPSSVKATTDGVVRPPSAFGTTSACPPSIVAATTEFVVPRSMPTALAITAPLVLDLPLAALAGRAAREKGKGRRARPDGARVRSSTSTATDGTMRDGRHAEPSADSLAWDEKEKPQFATTSGDAGA